ncbi:MAG: FMN-binding negative transcriptional regulator, partial [Pseudomonadota bacterium]
ELHVMRSNPLARARGEARPALMAVTGPDAYVSPDWYGLADQVPTWNYIAVHLRGPLELLPPESLRSLLDRLSDAMEARLDKQPWTSAKMSPGLMERMMRSLVPARMRIESVDSTWKLNQNKPDTARVQAAEQIAGARSPGSEHAALAALMRAVPPQI